MLTINELNYSGTAVPEAIRCVVGQEEKWTWDRLSVQSTEIMTCTGSTDTSIPIVMLRTSEREPALPLFWKEIRDLVSAGEYCMQELCVPVSGIYSVTTGFFGCNGIAYKKIKENRH